MLTEFRVENFKAFGEVQRIPIRPITLIYGPNSSGKSSILQALLLLKQTIQEAESSEIPLLPKGRLVDLGGFREFVHGHDVAKILRCTFIMDMRESQRFLRIVGDKAGIRVSFGYDDASESADLTDLDLLIDSSESPVATYRPRPVGEEDLRPPGLPRQESGRFGMETERALKLSSINRSHPFWAKLHDEIVAKVLPRFVPEMRERLKVLKTRLAAIEEDNSELPEAKRRPYRKRREKEIREEITQLESALSKYENFTLGRAIDDFESATSGTFLGLRNFLPFGGIGFGRGYDVDYLTSVFSIRRFSDVTSQVSMLGAELRRVIETSVYVGPLRDYPERYYIFSGSSSAHVGKSGKSVPDVLFRNTDVRDRVNQQLQRFKLGYTLDVASVGGEASGLQDVFSLRLVKDDSGVSSTIVDVGFGFSQVLPILVQTMLSQRTLVMIEQPEIHLHPALQAELGDVFIESALGEQHNRLLIETHSEHILLRILRRLREQRRGDSAAAPRVSPSDIAVLFVSPGDGESRVSELRISEDGRLIDSWPEGFFEEGFRERFS